MREPPRSFRIDQNILNEIFTFNAWGVRSPFALIPGARRRRFPGKIVGAVLARGLVAALNEHMMGERARSGVAAVGERVAGFTRQLTAGDIAR